MKVIRFIFEGLFPAIISVGVAIGFQWSWGMWLTLYIIFSGIGHLIYLRIRGKEEVTEVLSKKYVICSITLMILGIITIVMGFIWEGKQIIVVFGIALLSAGIALILGKLAEKANQEIQNYLVKKAKSNILK